uniref:Putative conserved plasma membrane protein n=1 Tax=Triatoma infestans TaxID=30076 RepID=A0A023F7T8_TRIIF
MAEGNPAVVFEKEVYVKKLKRGLDNWREVALLANSVLLWKKKYYPWIIMGCITLLFLELAYYDPSVLTIVSLTILCITLVDYFGPIISCTVWKQENWTANKERELEEICRSLANFLVTAKLTWTSLMDLKATRPNLYYTVTIIVLCILAWIGNNVNNFLITYSLVLVAFLMPGLIHNGIIQNYYQTLLMCLTQMLRGTSTPKTKLH